MIKRLSKIGNGHALFLDKAILELVHIDPDQPVKLEVHGRMLLIQPVQDRARAKRFGAAKEKVRARYSKVFKRLAE